MLRLCYYITSKTGSCFLNEGRGNGCKGNPTETAKKKKKTKKDHGFYSMSDRIVKINIVFSKRRN